MANINQTLIVRTDLFNDVGLLSAQVGHIHMELIRQILVTGLEQSSKDTNCLNANAISVVLDPDCAEWLKEPYLLVKQVGCLEALQYYQGEAIGVELPVRQWTDTVYVNLTPTVQKAFPKVLVGISIGPADSDKIRTVVGDLPLLKGKIA